MNISDKEIRAFRRVEARKHLVLKPVLDFNGGIQMELDGKAFDKILEEEGITIETMQHIAEFREELGVE